MNLLTGFAYVFFAPIIGGLLAGVDRRISARMQGRVGPPILQPFYDVAKLFSKEEIAVHKTQKFFVVFFLLFMVFTGGLFFSGGDLLLVVFAFTLSSIFLVLGACSTSSVYSHLGAQRELLQMMSYEPVVLLMTVGFYMATGTFQVEEIMYQPYPALFYLPGVLIAFVYILTIKLRKSPFDLSTSHHGHQEIVKGITTEFSGITLGIIELTHWYENVLLMGLVYLFFSFKSIYSIPLALAACGVIYFLEILMDNVFARFKWEMVLKSAWTVGLTIAFINLLILLFL